MDILSNFSETLSELMLIDDLNAVELSKYVNIERSTITRYLERKSIPKLPYAVEIADYFGCSLDYLFCLTSEYSKKKYMSCPPFSEVFQHMLNTHNCTRYRIEKDLNFPTNTLVDWFHGRRIPKIDNLIKLAEYFNCTLDEIVGRKVSE